jgi:hypothetical protein
MSTFSHRARLVFVLLVPAALALYGCGAAGVGEEEQPEFYFEANLNGESWQGEQIYSSRASLFRKGENLHMLTIAQGYFAESGRYDELLTISTHSLTLGTHPIEAVANDTTFAFPLVSGAYFSEFHGDQPIGDYKTPPAGSNASEQAGTLTLTRLDLDAGVAEGTFEALLVVWPDDAVGRSAELRRRPDTLRFTDGRFRLPIEINGQ